MSTKAGQLHDGAGDRTSLTDRNGNLTSYAYDANTRLASVQQKPDPAGTLGLVSDANTEVARAWPQSALAPLVDVAVFSSHEHVRKPDPALYQAVCQRLAIAAADCLYVGNGDGDELKGAMEFGMPAVLYSAPGEWPGREAAAWNGRRVDKLADVAFLV